MNFLDMKSDLKPKNYEWYRGVSGSWHHWEKRVLNGEIILKVEGDESGGYWGSIRIMLNRYGKLNSIFFSTWPDKGLHVPFKTPENCAVTIDNVWKEMINNESTKCHKLR
jgi:hypothetical protein